MYFLYGTEPFLITNELNKILKENDSYEIYFDETSPVEDIFQEINTVSLFSEEKTLIIKDHPILESDFDQCDEFIEAIKNATGILLIFVFNGKPEKSVPLIKFLLKSSQSKAFNTVDSKDMPTLIKKIVFNKGGEITHEGIMKIISNLPNDMNLIINEIDKLIMENPNITIEQIDNSLSHYSSDDVFSFSKTLTSSHPEEIITKYIEKKRSDLNPMFLISQIASIYNLAILVHEYKEQNFSNSEIADKLKIHPFRIKKAQDLLYISSFQKIKSIINDLADLEYKVKNGIIDINIGLDSLVLNLAK